MSDTGPVEPETKAATSLTPPVPATQAVNMVGSSSLVVSLSVSRLVKIASVTLRDFRAFPGGTDPTVFNFGEDGKNLILFGENGAGKSSLFHALKLLFNPTPPTKAFETYRHVFSKHDGNNPGLVAVKLTAGTPTDYTWDSGNPHPATNEGDVTFQEVARRATFLDYKALLRTSLMHEEADHVDLFDLVVNTLLREAEFPDGRTVTVAWQELLAFVPKLPPPREADETEEDYAESLKELPKPEEQQKAGAEDFWKQFGDLLGRIVPKANLYLSEHLQPSLSIQLTPYPEKQTDGDPHRKLLLTATYAGHRVEHPAQFLNEARLSAIALALYLAAVIETNPATTAVPALSGSAHDSFRPLRLLVLDDPLLGLDLSHRLPLLDLLQRTEFADWQVILLTYDANWFDMAVDQLPVSWANCKIHAKAHPDGWEFPILEVGATYLDHAWNHIQNGDFKAAAVYLRTAWENTMRGFCEARHLKVPLKRSMYEYKAEEFWNLVKSYEFKPDHLLVDARLAGEIKLCQDYVLNPLCHNDPARPTREEVRRTHNALQQLTTLLDQDVAWRRKVGKGKTPAKDFALTLAGELLVLAPLQASVLAQLLRSAFDQGLWRFCARHTINFTFTCDVPLNTARLWHEAVNGAGGLAASQAAFVATITAHTDLMLNDSPDNSVFAAKSLADLQALFTALRGASPANAPKMAMDQW